MTVVARVARPPGRLRPSVDLLSAPDACAALGACSSGLGGAPRREASARRPVAGTPRCRRPPCTTAGTVDPVGARVGRDVAADGVAMMWPLVVPTVNRVGARATPWRARLTLTMMATVTLLWLAFGLARPRRRRSLGVPAGSPWWQLAFLAAAMRRVAVGTPGAAAVEVREAAARSPRGADGVWSAPPRAGLVAWRRCARAVRAGDGRDGRRPQRSSSWWRPACRPGGRPGTRGPGATRCRLLLLGLAAVAAVVVLRWCRRDVVPGRSPRWSSWSRTAPWTWPTWPVPGRPRDQAADAPADGNDRFLDGPACRRLAVVDFDPATGRPLPPPARFVRQAGRHRSETAPTSSTAIPHPRRPGRQRLRDRVPDDPDVRGGGRAGSSGHVGLRQRAAPGRAAGGGVGQRASTSGPAVACSSSGSPARTGSRSTRRSAATSCPTSAATRCSTPSCRPSTTAARRSRSPSTRRSPTWSRY